MVFEDVRWTYAELDARVNRLARLLLRPGAGPEQVVALALPRSIEMVVALFAVLRTGAAYLPLELDLPADRLAVMLDDARPGAACSPPRGALDRCRPARTSSGDVARDRRRRAPRRDRRPRRRRAHRRRAGAVRRRAHRTGSTTRRTSSTPRARPAGPRAWSRRTAA